MIHNLKEGLFFLLGRTYHKVIVFSACNHMLFQFLSDVFCERTYINK